MEKTAKVVTVYSGSEVGRAIEWVEKARGNDPRRMFLSTIRIERAGPELTIVATDSRRLHMATIPYAGEDFTEDATYTLSGGKGTIVLTEYTEGTFPHWQKVIPEPNVWATTYFGTVPKRGKDYSHYITFSKNVIQLCHDLHCLVNIRFLEDVGEGTWEVYLRQPIDQSTDKDGYLNTAIRFNSGNRSAIIMPLANV